MLETILGLFAGAGTGGVIGILGGLLKQWLTQWQHKAELAQELSILKEKNDHERLMMDKQNEHIRLEAENAVKLAELRTAGETEKAAYDAMAKSYEADKAVGDDGVMDRYPRVYAVIDFLRLSTRPVLTWYLVVIYSVFAGWVTYKTFALLPDMADYAFLRAAFTHVLQTVAFMVTAAWGWWFVSRPSRG